MRKRVFQHYCESLLTLTAITQSHLHPVCYHFTGCPLEVGCVFFSLSLAGLHKLTLLSKVTVKVFWPKIPSHVVLCTDSVNWEAVPPVIKVKEDFMLNYTGLNMGSYDCNQKHRQWDIKLPGHCKCQSFSALISGQLFRRPGSAAGLGKVLNLLRS